MSEVSKHTYWVLFDATTDVKFIKKTMPEGFLAFFDSEECARKSKAKNSGTDYKRVDFVPESVHQRKLSEQAQEIERLTAELGDGTTGKKYRAELYDEVWQKSRDMGYVNVTTALAELERARKAQCERKFSGEVKPCAIECGLSNGDGTYSVHIKRYPLPSYLEPHKDWPVKLLYASPPIPATQVLVERELLEGLIDPFCDGSEAHQRIRAILSSKGGDV